MPNKYILFFTFIILFGCSKDDGVDLSNAVNIFQSKKTISFVNKKERENYRLENSSKLKEILNSKDTKTMLLRKESNNQIKEKSQTEPENKIKGNKGNGGFLQSIVASLAPEDAEKLMQKANALGNAENITLKQLKSLLADDSDQEDESNDAKRKHQDDSKEEPTSNNKLSSKDPLHIDFALSSSVHQLSLKLM